MDTCQLVGDFQASSQVPLSAISGKLWRSLLLFMARVLWTLPLASATKPERIGAGHRELIYIYIKEVKECLVRLWGYHVSSRSRYSRLWQPLLLKD